MLYQMPVLATCYSGDSACLTTVLLIFVALLSTASRLYISHMMIVEGLHYQHPFGGSLSSQLIPS